MNNNKRIFVLLNGPPRSGKDTVADYLTTVLGNSVKISLAASLKNMVHRAYGLTDVPYNHYENTKDEPNEDFLGITPRQAYRAFSETYMKPLHGNRIWAKILLLYIEEMSYDIYIISDVGFEDEVHEIIQVA